MQLRKCLLGYQTAISMRPRTDMSAHLCIETCVLWFSVWQCMFNMHTCTHTHTHKQTYKHTQIHTDQHIMYADLVCHFLFPVFNHACHSHTHTHTHTHTHKLTNVRSYRDLVYHLLFQVFHHCLHVILQLCQVKHAIKLLCIQLYFLLATLHHCNSQAINVFSSIFFAPSLMQQRCHPCIQLYLLAPFTDATTKAPMYSAISSLPLHWCNNQSINVFSCIFFPPSLMQQPKHQCIQQDLLSTFTDATAKASLPTAVSSS